MNHNDKKEGRPVAYYVYMVLLSIFIFFAVVVILAVGGFIAYGISTDRSRQIIGGVGEILSSNKADADPEIEVIPIKRPYEK